MAAYPSRLAVFFWTTGQGPAWMTVTATAFPCGSKTWVIPILRPKRPIAMIPHPRKAVGSELDLDIHPGRQVQPHELVHRLGGGLDDVHHPYVGPDLELLPGLLIHVGRAEHRVPADLGGQRDRPGDQGARAL